MRLDIGDVELCNLVESSAQVTRIQAHAKEHTLALDLPPKPVYARADVERLKQVLDNLLSNAIKYTPRGGSICLQLRVNVESKEADRQRDRHFTRRNGSR